MVKRWIENDVKSAMAARRGVFLTGARQSGKTTLASMLKFANAKRLTLDNAGVRVAAQTDRASGHSGVQASEQLMRFVA